MILDSCCLVVALFMFLYFEWEPNNRVQRKETCLWETKSWNCIFQHWHVEITVYVALLVAVMQLCTERVDILFSLCLRAHLIASSVVIIHCCFFLVLFAKRDEARFVYFFHLCQYDSITLMAWQSFCAAQFRPVVFEMRFWLKITIIVEVLEC